MEEQKEPMNSGVASVKAAVKLRKEGLEEGHPEVAFDPKERKHYHLDRLGRRKYHDVPEGFEFTDSGELKPINKD